MQACHSITLSLEQLNHFKLSLKTHFRRPKIKNFPDPPSGYCLRQTFIRTPLRQILDPPQVFGILRLSPSIDAFVTILLCYITFAKWPFLPAFKNCAIFGMGCDSNVVLAFLSLFFIDSCFQFVLQCTQRKSDKGFIGGHQVVADLIFFFIKCAWKAARTIWKSKLLE